MNYNNLMNLIKKQLLEPCRIHMLGIGGIGMAGLAFLLKERGHVVSGSDAQENRQTKWLREKGIPIQKEVPADVEWIIRSRAVPDSHPDVVDSAVPVSWRGDVLPELLRDRFTIAVSGTHGKTTTASMIAQILDCGYCIGGEVVGFDGVARDGDIMVVEADESDGTVANYHPDIAVITNIEYDHMEHHESAKAFEECFQRFILNTKQTLIYCAEDPAATRLCKDNPKAIPYGLDVIVGQASLYSESLCGCQNQTQALEYEKPVPPCPTTRRVRRLESCRTGFPVSGEPVWMSKSDTRFQIREARPTIKTALPGRHNQLNASAALAVCRLLAIPDAVNFQALENLRPIKRRFEIVFDGDYTVVSDYAHHPTEIRALIDTALETLKPKRLLGVFQPHRYTRTLALGPDFPPAFQGLEKLWLLPVYAASEEPLKGGTTEDLIGHFSKDWKNKIYFFHSLEKIGQTIRDELREGDVLLIIGAGDVDQIGEWMNCSACRL